MSRRVVRKETKVVSVRHVPGGVKIVVSAPLFAAAKTELKLPLEYSEASVILDLYPKRLIKKKPLQIEKI
jgi:hypothetical protein